MYFVARKLPANCETPGQNYCLSSTAPFKKLFEFIVLILDLGFALKNRAAGAKICDVPQSLTAGSRDTPRDSRLLRAKWILHMLYALYGRLFVIRAEFRNTEIRSFPFERRISEL